MCLACDYYHCLCVAERITFELVYYVLKYPVRERNVLYFSPIRRHYIHHVNFYVQVQVAVEDRPEADT